MESRSVASFIYIGTAVRYLQDTLPNFYPPFKVRDMEANYQSLLQWLQQNRLRVTYRIAKQELGPVIREMKRLKRDEDGLRELTPDLASRICNAANQVRQTIDAEAVDFKAYIVTPKRYTTESLLNDPGSLMAPKVFGSLSVMAKSDFTEACRAIAFELPTAAAFHLMRGTEEMLRNFYCSIVKQKRVEPLLWGPMVTGLRNRKENSPPGVLLNNLDNLRVSFRNPTQHPDKVYDIHEVQDLLSLCLDVINRMVRHLDQSPDASHMPDTASL